jgi:hypothetical protein
MIDLELIERWRKADELYRKYKRLENELRQDICQDLLKGKSEGAHYFDVAGLPVKATRRVIYSLDKSLVELYEEGALNATEEACLTVSLRLRQGEFKQVDPALIPHIIAALTTKDGMPSLEIDQ